MASGNDDKTAIQSTVVLLSSVTTGDSKEVGR